MTYEVYHNLEAGLLFALSLFAFVMRLVYRNREDDDKTCMKISGASFLMVFSYIFLSRGAPFAITNLTGYDIRNHCVYNAQTADFWQIEVGHTPDCSSLEINYLFFNIIPSQEAAQDPVSGIPLPDTPAFW